MGSSVSSLGRFSIRNILGLYLSIDAITRLRLRLSFGLPSLLKLCEERFVENTDCYILDNSKNYVSLDVLGIYLRDFGVQLGYAVQDLDAPALTKIPAANTASNLTGKIAGNQK